MARFGSSLVVLAGALLCLPACRIGYDAPSALVGDGGFDGGPDGGPFPVWPPRFQDLCGVGAMTVIQDGNPGDDATGALLASFTNSTCGGGATVRMLSQDTPGLLDPITRGPLLGPNDLGVVGGADSVQDVMTYLAPTYSPIVMSFPGTQFVVTERASGAVLLDVPESTISGTHDYGIVQVSVDPVSNSVVLSGYGVWQGGTLAAGYWFANFLGDAFLTASERWYVIEWTNGDGDPDPSAGDTFTLIASGS